MAQTVAQKQWFHRKANAHNTVAAAASAAATASATQGAEDNHHLRLYSEREWALNQLGAGAAARTKAIAALKARKSRRLSLNVVRNNIDAWQNLICRGRPHINFLTKGADWSLQKTARMRTRFVEAHFLKRELYTKAARVVKHAGIFGRGFIQVVKRHSMIDYEVVPPHEIRVDPSEANADDPRCIYRERTIDKFVLADLFPEHAARILAETDDRLTLVDAWHLPSGPKAKDGVYAQVIPGVVLLQWRKYTWQAFPIVPFFFDDAPIGWGGQGIAEELSGIQFEINSVLRTIQNNVYFGGNIKAAVERGTEMAASPLSNGLGCPTVTFIKTPPVFFTGNLGLAELLQHLSNLRAEAAQIIGISQLYAESGPTPTISGRARMLDSQQHSQRFKTHQDRHEEFFKRLAERTLEAAADLDAAGEDIEVIFPGRDHLEVIRYSDVAGKPEDFDCEAWSASLAGETPAGRLAHIEQMMGLGMIDLNAAMALYDVPYDLRSHMEAVLAPIELARESIDRIIEDGQAVTPTPVMDLKRAVSLSAMWIQRGMLRGVDPQRLYLLLDFNKVASMLLARTAPPANGNAAPAAAAAMPPGMPGAAPPDLNAALAPERLPAVA